MLSVWNATQKQSRIIAEFFIRINHRMKQKKSPAVTPGKDRYGTSGKLLQEAGKEYRRCLLKVDTGGLAVNRGLKRLPGVCEVD